MVIRPFRETDYEAFAALLNAVDPKTPISAEEIRRTDRLREPKYRFGRFLAEEKGKLIGAGIFFQPPAEYDPRKFWLHFALHPDHRSPVLLEALYRTVMEAVSAFNPTALRITVREDREDEQAFFRKEGFRELRRNWEMILDLKAFDPALFREAEGRIPELGIEIRTLEELMAQDPDWLPKLYRLNNAVHKDMPFIDPPTPISFEEFRRRMVEEPSRDLLPDGWFIAVKEGAYIGHHNLWKTENPETLLIGTTGVLRPYRRQGIALALKLRGIRYAKDRGARFLITHNDSLNEPILALNRKLGFRPRHGWVTLGKNL